MNSLEGKTAIVTGASRGIGLAICRALQAAGVRLGMLARRQPPQDVNGIFVGCDFAEVESIPQAVRQIIDGLGVVDVVVNNAGMFLEKSVSETTLEEWERVLRVNLTATFLVTREVLGGMIARRQGRIINIASTASVQGYLHQAAYVASKHAMLGFARAVALEVRPYNIHVHSICPGGVKTDLLEGTCLGRRLQGQPMIQPEDVAAMVLFLLRQPDNVDLPELIVRRFETAVSAR
ncbi:MAG: SDR family oxidoreductase [Verrucomicrobiae bacterium]|nr:SDR family oxidoreductase [Verrucomicrobiae bacterium]